MSLGSNFVIPPCRKERDKVGQPRSAVILSEVSASLCEADTQSKFEALSWRPSPPPKFRAKPRDLDVLLAISTGAERHSHRMARRENSRYADANPIEHEILRLRTMIRKRITLLRSG
jgi:hypothetical protein